MPIKNRLAEMHAEITEWRRDLHEHPEILFETHRTSAIVEAKLKDFGCDEVAGGIGRTGVVGVIHGKQTGSGKVIGLRADMDALPIHEETGLDYASKTDGAMHACGHDGHTAMLLGAAKYLSETRNFDGTVVVIFQPAEEGGGGGREMCNDGMMERFGIQEVYGMHNWPGLPVGEFAIRPGPFFAAADLFEIELEGLGGHAAKPQETVDTTVMASQQGTVRTLSAEVRDLAEKRMGEICAGVAATYGGTITLDYQRNYPVMVNSEEQTTFAAQVAETVTGKPTQDALLVMGGEDFAFMLEERPGAYIVVGNGDTAMVHHPKYNFNDETTPAGASWWAEIVEQRMPAA